MSLHYLNPDDEPRDCGLCAGIPLKKHGKVCPFCNGTGRLGVEGAEPDVYIATYFGDAEDPKFCWTTTKRNNGFGHPFSKPFPTESAALEAARRAHREAK